MLILRMLKGSWRRSSPSSEFVIDGEAVILGLDGVSDFEALYSGRHNDEVQLYAFDVLAGSGRTIMAHCG
jgi:ATP-dependent DNA ligase